jgi:uncharacterized protein (DUF486 family)
MNKSILTILLLVLSNTFMTFAWYGHLKYGNNEFFRSKGLWIIILVSWGIALLEYIFQVPANKIGYQGSGGPFNLWELKVIQEFIHLTVFTVFVLVVFKTETLRWNHIVGFVFLVLAVYFIFRK